MKTGEDPTREALNCVRVLGRVLVVVYEQDQDEEMVDEGQGTSSGTAEPTDAQLRDHFAWNTLWKRRLAPREQSASTSDRAQGDSTNERDTAESRASSLAERLFNCTIDLLFCAGFTVPESVKGQSDDKINVGALHQYPLNFKLTPRYVVCHLGKGCRLNT